MRPSRIFGRYVECLSEVEFVDYAAYYEVGHTNYVLLGWAPLS
jgi:hypothetical protein